MGMEKMMQAIQKWTPDYNKVICALKNALIQAIYSQNAPSNFLEEIRFGFLQVV